MGAPRVLNLRRDRIPVGAVFIGRRAGHKWGNPFTIGVDGSRDAVCDKHAAWLLEQPELMAALPELRGRDLVCYCAPYRCHGDLLLALANPPERLTQEPPP